MSLATSMITARQAGQDELQRIEALLLDVSTRFIDLPADQVDGQIQDAQRRVCDFLDLDRSTLWQLSADEPAKFFLTHLHRPADSPSPPERADAQELFPWLCEQVRHGKTTAVSDLAELPPEAARDKESFLHFGTKSTVVVPLSIGGAVAGVLSFATVRKQRGWSPGVVQRLELLAQVFANAIARARGERALRERQALLHKAAYEWRATFDAIGDPVLLLDAEQKIVRANAAASAALGVPLEQVVGRHCYALFHGATSPVDSCPIAKALKTRTPHEAEILDRNRGACCLYSVYPMPPGVDDGLAAICVAKDITARKEAEEQVRHTLDEVRRLRDQLHEQNVYLQQEVKSLSGHPRLIGNSVALRGVLAQVEHVAATQATVLLLGETGTGKELIASEIHELSPRRERLMVRVNCSAIPATLIESELFGREKGAYTGALSKQIGRFEMANGSTLFLDEIGELPPEIQVKLLRVLQERQIERLGSPKPISVDVRIIAATNRDLEKSVREGKFRQDLFYRLNVFPITIPPLRERREDIPAMVSALVTEFGAAFGKNIESIAKESMEALQRYPWPGNVRELRNAIERAMIVANGPKLWVEPPRPMEGTSRVDLSFRAIEREHILRVLESTGGRIRGKNGAAEVLQLKPTTLESRMAKLGIPTRKKGANTR